MNLLILIFACTYFVHAQEQAPSLNEFFRNKTKLDNPLELRDPFKSPPVKNESKKNKNGFSGSGTGNYTNIPDTGVENINIQQMKVVGVLIGKERRAMVQAKENDKNVTILKEGMKVGVDGAELKAILPGGIILVEKIINVYGQEEFLETVIPISK